MPKLLRRAAVAAAAIALLAVVPSAFAHARISPPVAVGGGQLFALVVPTEEQNLTTTRVEMTVPEGFLVGGFERTPGWKRRAVTEGSGEEAAVKRVTWSGGSVPIGEAAVFRFSGRTNNPGDYTFSVRQTYSDGSVVNWSGPEDSDEPAPVVQVKSSLGGGGSSTLAIVALVVGGVALLLALVGLAAGSRRQLA